jgi:hypothetical protein
MIGWILNDKLDYKDRDLDAFILGIYYSKISDEDKKYNLLCLADHPFMIEILIRLCFVEISEIA